MNELNRLNFNQFLKQFMVKQSISARQVASAIGCSEAVVRRIVARQSHPSDDLLKQGAIIFEIGFEKYKTLSASEKEKISDAIGAVSGGALGFASITATVGSIGVAGLSAAGITSGLAGLGAIVGGGMVAGILVAAAIPIACAAAGYGLIRTIKFFADQSTLDRDGFDLKWEIAASDEGPSGSLVPG